VEKLGAVQIVEMLSIVFNFVGGSCAFVDESADRFRIGGAQARSFADFIVMIEPRVTHGNEVGPAERFTVQGRGDALATVRNAALFYARHGSTQDMLDIRAGLHFRLRPETSNIVILVSPKCSEPARRTDMQRKN